MSQIKLQSLIFLCPVCNVTKYVNIQKYINNILNVNRHKLTCPLCINNYTGINNLIIHIITDHKTLLSVDGGNVSVNLNNFVGNHIITNVESVCGDLKIRELPGNQSVEFVNGVNANSSDYPKSIPYLQTFNGDPSNGEVTAEINNTELVILQPLTNENYATQISPEESVQKPEEKADLCADAHEHVNADSNNADFLPVRPDGKVPDEMCFIDNSFCDKFFDDNKFKENDGLKFDIDQFLNEMSNTNSFTHSANLDASSSCQSISMDVNNAQATDESIAPTQVPMEDLVQGVDGKNNFMWDQINGMNQLFNINQINLLQTNAIQESNEDDQSQTDKLDVLFIENAQESPDNYTAMQEDAAGTSPSSQKSNSIGFNSRNKSFQSAFYENVFHTDETGNKRLKSNVETKQTNRLKVFRDKQNKFKNQRLKKLQFLTMNKKFEDHLSLDETRQESIQLSRMTASTNPYTLPPVPLLPNETDSVSNKRQSEQSIESSSKYARTVDAIQTTVETDPVLFKCKTCDFFFQNATILAMHNQLIHNITEEEEAQPDGHKCEHCSRVFKMKGSLMIHLKVAHMDLSSSSSRQPPKIDVCSDVPTSTVRTPPPPNFTCSLCSKSFKKEPHLLQHLKTHEGKQWECKLCSKLFTTKYFLKKHNRLHTGEMPYKCGQCERSFTFQQSFHKHLLYHSDEKPHVCAQCGRAFKELSTLHNHERIHSGEKPFCCETCGKSFRQRVSYLVHQRIHTGVTPYKCSACHKRFRYKISDKMHKCSLGDQGRIVKAQSPLIEKLLARTRAAHHGPAATEQGNTA